MISSYLWTTTLVVAVFTLGVWAVDRLAPLTDLGLLPVHRRHRVEWCQAHERPVLLLGSTLAVLLSLISTAV